MQKPHVQCSIQGQFTLSIFIKPQDSTFKTIGSLTFTGAWWNQFGQVASLIPSTEKGKTLTKGDSNGDLHRLDIFEDLALNTDLESGAKAEMSIMVFLQGGRTCENRQEARYPRCKHVAVTC